MRAFLLIWMGRARAAGNADLVPSRADAHRYRRRISLQAAVIEATARAGHVTAEHGLTAVLGYVDKRDDIFNAGGRAPHTACLRGTYHKQ